LVSKIIDDNKDYLHFDNNGYTLVKYCSFVMDELYYNMIVASQQVYDNVITLEQDGHRFSLYNIRDGSNYDVLVNYNVNNQHIKVVATNTKINMFINNVLQFAILFDNDALYGLGPDQTINWIMYSNYIINIPVTDIRYFQFGVEYIRHTDGTKHRIPVVEFPHHLNKLYVTHC